MAKNGIDFYSLKPGTTLEVITKNTIYKILKPDDSDIAVIEGGNYFKKPTEVSFFGSSDKFSLDIGWINAGQHMEFSHPHKKDKTVRTSRVENATISGPDWSYDMDWPSLNDEA